MRTAIGVTALNASDVLFSFPAPDGKLRLYHLKGSDQAPVKYLPAGSSQSGCALASYKVGSTGSKGVWLSFLADNSSNHILVCDSGDGGVTARWSAEVAVPGQSAQRALAPALAIMGDTLWIAFISNDNNNFVLFSYLNIGGEWGPGNTDFESTAWPPQSSQGPVSLAVAPGETELWISYISNDTHNRILISSTATPGLADSWTPPYYLPGQSSQSSTSMTFYNGQLWIAYISNDNNNKILLSYSSTPSKSDSWTTIEVPGQSSGTAPALVVQAPGLLVGFGSNDNNNLLLLCGSSDPTNASSWVRLAPNNLPTVGV